MAASSALSARGKAPTCGKTAASSAAPAQPAFVLSTPPPRPVLESVRRGAARAPVTPKAVPSVGPTARTRIFLSVAPRVTKPLMRTSSPSPTWPRVAMLTSRASVVTESRAAEAAAALLPRAETVTV